MGNEGAGLRAPIGDVEPGRRGSRKGEVCIWGWWLNNAYQHCIYPSIIFFFSLWQDPPLPTVWDSHFTTPLHENSPKGTEHQALIELELHQRWYVDVSPWVKT
jgi:hypothetical protein